MEEKEITELFNHRDLNSKTNNFIFSQIDDFRMLNGISDRCSISTPDNNIDIDYAQNIKIDLTEVNVQDILSYTLERLKKSSLLDATLDYTLEFHNKFDLFRFQNVLHTYNTAVQLIFYNVEGLSLEEQMLFNEIYYFNSIFFNANSFIKGDNFQTYFLSGERVLDDRENYTKIKLVKGRSSMKEIDVKTAKIQLTDENINNYLGARFDQGDRAELPKKLIKEIEGN